MLNWKFFSVRRRLEDLSTSEACNRCSDDDILRAATVAKASSSYTAVDYALSRSSSSAISVRDERYRASTANSSSLYPGGRLWVNRSLSERAWCLRRHTELGPLVTPRRWTGLSTTESCIGPLFWDICNELPSGPVKSGIRIEYLIDFQNTFLVEAISFSLLLKQSVDTCLLNDIKRNISLAVVAFVKLNVARLKLCIDIIMTI